MKPSFIIAIDPGSEYSAVVILNSVLKPVFHEKILNEDLPEILKKSSKLGHTGQNTDIAIEMVACYGMPVGAEVFNTCVWIGKFIQILEYYGYKKIQYIYRKDEKMNLCGSMRANDANIRQALIDRFALGVPNGGKGTKKDPGFFYGFASDQWAAMAVGVTYYDLYIGGK